MLSQFQGYLFLGVFWLTALAAIKLSFKKNTTAETFLVSEKTVGFLIGAVSVAAAWVWAGALFLSSQKAYEQGLPGLFWFTLPNAGALILFSFLAVRMRKIFDRGYTLPEFMGRRFDQRMKLLYSFSIFAAQNYAIVFNLTAALLMLNLVTGIPKSTLIVILGLMMVSLSVLKGIRSSLTEDTIKAVLICMVAFIIVPWTIFESGGLDSITSGLGGIKGTFTHIFDPAVAWSFGVPVSITLFSGVVMDQQQWQRAFSMKHKIVRRSFLWGGFLFAFVPIMLGMLGYVAVNHASILNIPKDQNQLAGFYAAVYFLPGIAVLGFTAMVLASLVAAGSSALTAVSSIGAVDIYKFFRPDPSDRALVMASRISMVIMILIGMSISLIPNIQLLYLILIMAPFRGALLMPTILSLFWSKLSPLFTFWGIILGMVIGVPLFVYGSIVKNPTISSVGSLVPIAITLIACLVGGWLRPKIFNYATLSDKTTSAS
ncbi:MAG: hypothetical protein HYT98_04260 [Candidatus Sungbacteria bacterium]|nr:hypothetical protein [Candidatus Sungbacteria bacterium]